MSFSRKLTHRLPPNQSEARGQDKRSQEVASNHQVGVSSGDALSQFFGHMGVPWS